MRLIKRFFTIFMLTYTSVLILLWVCQERLIFFPKSLEQDFAWNFNDKFDEFFIYVGDEIFNQKSVALNLIAFRAENPKGAVLFLHGNAGNLGDFAHFRNIFLKHGFDFYVYDYRGFGKSGGRIYNSYELFNDAGKIFEFMKNDFVKRNLDSTSQTDMTSKYQKNNFIIIGYSIGSGIAANIGTQMKVHTILIAPYFSLRELAVQKLPFVPSFLVRYDIKTNEYLQKIAAQKSFKIDIIYAEFDTLIPPLNALRLAKIAPNARVFEVMAGHNDILYNPKMNEIFDEILTQK